MISLRVAATRCQKWQEVGIQQESVTDSTQPHSLSVVAVPPKVAKGKHRGKKQVEQQQEGEYDQLTKAEPEPGTVNPKGYAS